MEDKVKKDSVEETTENPTPPTEETPKTAKPKKKRRGSLSFVDAEHDPLLHSNLEPKAYPYEKHWHYPGG